MAPLMRALSLTEQKISFRMPSNIIFNQTKATSEENTHVKHTMHKDKTEETREGVIEDIHLLNQFELVLPRIKQNIPTVNGVEGVS